MVKTGSPAPSRPRRPSSTARDAIADVRFRNDRMARVGIDVVSCEHLRTRAAASLRAPQRPDFHLLWLVVRRRGPHRVDFVERARRPGDLAWVHAGQVQQWRLNPSLQGPILLIGPHALAPSVARAAVDMQLLALDRWPAVSRLPAAAFRQCLQAVEHLREEAHRFEGEAIDAAIIWHGLLSLLLGVARELQAAHATGDDSRDSRIHRDYLQQMERQMAQRPTVQGLSARLGYSESTVSRACVAATGLTAKALLDRRIALEAKRLLLHSPASVAEIAHRLGFSEATNFVKFFRRLEGSTPIGFREGQQR